MSFFPPPAPSGTFTIDGKNDRKRSRAQYDPDHDICWDWLRPNGCNRDNCHWKHDQRKFIILNNQNIII